MKTTKKKSLLTIALALGLSLAVLSGCSQNDAASAPRRLLRLLKAARRWRAAARWCSR